LRPRTPLQYQYTVGRELQFTAGAEGLAALWSGWSEPDDRGTWSIGLDAELLMNLEPIPREELELCCWAQGLVGPGVEEQVVAVEANGITVDEWRFTLAQPERQFRTRLPTSGWNRGGELHIVLRPNRLTCPRAEGWSLDSRQLGVALRGLRLRPR